MTRQCGVFVLISFLFWSVEWVFFMLRLFNILHFGRWLYFLTLAECGNHSIINLRSHSEPFIILYCMLEMFRQCGIFPHFIVASKQVLFLHRLFCTLQFGRRLYVLTLAEMWNKFKMPFWTLYYLNLQDHWLLWSP